MKINLTDIVEYLILDATKQTNYPHKNLLKDVKAFITSRNPSIELISSIGETKLVEIEHFIEEFSGDKPIKRERLTYLQTLTAKVRVSVLKGTVNYMLRNAALNGESIVEVDFSSVSRKEAEIVKEFFSNGLGYFWKNDTVYGWE